MADHINIASPDYEDLHWRHRLEVAKLEAELSVVRMERDHWRNNLEAIHTRIARGDEFWLSIDGERVVVARVREPPD